MTALFFNFCLGVVILLFSTQTFVKSAEKITRLLRISPLIVGITIVAIGTSLPELAVSLIAIIKADSGLALGNIIGSNIINILMVLPAGILIGRLRIGTTKTQRNSLILLVVTFIFFTIGLLRIPHLYAGYFLLTLAVVFTITEFELGRFGQNHEDSARIKKYKREKFNFRQLLFLILAVGGIVMGGLLVVNSVENISLLTGLSTTILGLSLTAVVTSLPELLTTIFSQEEHQEKMTIGNILGSNIYNLLFIGGVIMLFPVATTVGIADWIWLILTVVCFVFMLRYYKGRPIPKWIGLILLILFLAYIISLGNK